MATGQFINGEFVSDERAKACVSALADIKDPEAFMRDVREALKPNGQMWDEAALVKIEQHLKGGDK